MKLEIHIGIGEWYSLLNMVHSVSNFEYDLELDKEKPEDEFGNTIFVECGTTNKRTPLRKLYDIFPREELVKHRDDEDADSVLLKLDMCYEMSDKEFEVWKRFN